MTPAEIIYHRRVRVLEHAAETGNVSQTCKTFGVSRTRFYEWRNVAEQYGLEALMPKERPAPQMPNATPTWVVNELLTLAVTEPTIACRQYADRLEDRGHNIGKSTVQDILVRHGLGRRHQRVARAAAIAALTSGFITETAVDDRMFGFVIGRPVPVTWSRWTVSTSGTSKVSARSTNSPRSTPRPVGRSS